MVINRFQKQEVTVLFHMLYIFQFVAYIWLFCENVNCRSRSLFLRWTQCCQFRHPNECDAAFICV